MREKYIDELTGGIWFEFGIHADGCVDVDQSTGDVFRHVPKDVAEAIIQHRQEFLDKLYVTMRHV